MTTTRSIETAETLASYTARIHGSEASETRRQARTKDLKLYNDSRLGCPDRLHLTSEAEHDLANLAGIPATYFSEQCDPELRALSFNHLLAHKPPVAENVTIISKGDDVYRVQDSTRVPSPRAPILEAIANALPKDLSPDEVKVIPYVFNGSMDLSIISEARIAEPQRGDTVAFGINLYENTQGAIQIQAAAYRCLCSNGAVMRICHGNKHRLRRPLSLANGKSRFFDRIRAFSRTAWEQWESHAEHLKKLVAVPLFPERRDELRARLRLAPFHLSNGIINQILRRLDEEVRRNAGNQTAYTLWNSMTYLGSHTDQSATSKYRLRIGAGELSQHESRTCATCRQTLISD